MGNFSVSLTNFGRIESAKIDVSKFMIFVGENNTGKSYVLQLLWGIIENRNFIFKNSDSKKLENDFLSIIKSNPNSDFKEKKIKLSQDFLQSGLDSFNESLNRNKDTLLNNIFNSTSVSINSLIIEKNKFPALSISYGINEVFDEEKEELSKLVAISCYLGKKKFISYSYPLEFEKRVISRIVEQVIIKAIFEDFVGFRNDAPLYFPASRAAFLQVYKALFGNNIREEISLEHKVSISSKNRDYSSIIPGLTVTKAVINFMLALLSFEESPVMKKKYSDELFFISEKLTEGKIVKTSDDRLVYIPGSNISTELPMHLTSSLVAETAPFYLFLSDKTDREGWIVEEIETHLHPQRQLQLVKLLFKLIHKGKFIWITTHSDSVAQQINNLLLISERYSDKIYESLSSSEKTLINKDEIINLKEVSLYQFMKTENITDIKKLTFGKYGYEIDSFNSLLDSLYDETESIQNLVDSWRNEE